MTRRTIGLIAGIVVVGAVIAQYPRQPNRAQQLADQAASPEQERLWQQVSARGTPPGLERVPVATAPVEPRHRQATPSARQAVPPGRGSLAPGVVTGIRAISSSLPAGASFGGMARVAEVDPGGERVRLDLAGGGSLTLVARIGGMPLGVAPGSAVQVAFESRPDAFERREILAVRTDAGALVASARESGEERITLKVGPPLNLTARQDPEASPDNGSLGVRVTVGATERDMKLGDPPLQIEGVTVRLLASVALPANPAADASPYAINLIAWRQPAAGEK